MQSRLRRKRDTHYRKRNKGIQIDTYFSAGNPAFYQGAPDDRRSAHVTDLPTEKIALKYKELWQVERVFRDVKTMLHTRPVYHTERRKHKGPRILQFLGSALVLRKELERRLNAVGHYLIYDGQ